MKQFIKFFTVLAFTGIIGTNSAFSQTTVIDSGTCGANLTWVLKSDSVLTISGSGAMDDYPHSWYSSYQNSITTVVIDSGVTNIGKSVFASCYTLTSVTIPNSVTMIGNGAFYNCLKLVSVTIPNSVTSIGVYSFTCYTAFYGIYYCNLNTIICEAITPPVIDQHTFRNISTTVPIHIPCNAVNAYKTANHWNIFTNFIGMPDTVFLFDTICQGTIYKDNGFSINTGAGTYYRTQATANNCSTVFCLTIYEYPFVPITHYSDTICEGTTYFFAGRELTNSGVYYDTLQNINLCDSIIELSLTVNPAYTVPIVATICEGKSYIFKGKLLTEEGIFYDSLQTIHGCDSIFELILTVNPTRFTQISDSIHQGKNYDFNGKLLTTDGIYYDTLQTFFYCDSIIKLTLTITNVGILEFQNSGFRISPNPTNNQLKIESGKLEIEKIEIFNTVGQILLSLPSSPSPETIIDISHLSNGIYFLKINNKIIKVIKY